MKFTATYETIIQSFSHAKQEISHVKEGKESSLNHPDIS